MKKLFADRKVCTGCRACEMVCSFSHLKEEINPKKSRIRVKQDLLQGLNEPIVCRQCPKPKCVEACPEKAIHQDPELKNPVIDATKCNLCLACQKACPFGAIFFDEEEKELLVCDLCQGDPLCVKFCRHYPHKTHAALGYMEPKEWTRLTKPIQPAD
jgi:carbon-monoxide dehydrogenase iron sulfur subunit